MKLTVFMSKLFKGKLIRETPLNDESKGNHEDRSKDEPVGNKNT